MHTLYEILDLRNDATQAMVELKASSVSPWKTRKPSIRLDIAGPAVGAGVFVMYSFAE